MNLDTREDKIFEICIYTFIAFLIVIMAYPFIFVISASISDSTAIARGEVWLYPVGFSTAAYKTVFANNDVWNAYGNTIWYVLVGTTYQLLMTSLLAYPLSQKHFSGRNVVMMFVTFTMFFGGGIVPGYLLVKALGLINSRWAIIIPSAISTYNLIIMRTFFQNIPDGMHEAATIDGAGEFRIFLRIYIPLSLPMLATITLFVAVGIWNSWFSAMLYLNKEKLWPLQMVLRKILIQFDANDMLAQQEQGREAVSLSIRYALIVVAILPIMCVYPFLQKYFVQGVMIGAIKG
ncbi:MAG: carbohydrate ABC transporter permease [Eubacteriales bacterium]